MKGILMSFRDYVTHGWNMVRSSLIGIGIGILPGVGATIASIVAYTTAKNISKTPEMFGKGSEEAIVAAESANNATTGGTLIPLLALGIPGGLADSVLLGALMIHNLAPGPMLYVHHPEIVNAIMAAHLVSHVLMFIFMTAGVLLFARLMLISRVWIFPTVLVVCILGAYTVNAQMFDVWVMLAFGVDRLRPRICEGADRAVRGRARSGATRRAGASHRPDGLRRRRVRHLRTPDRRCVPGRGSACTDLAGSSTPARAGQDVI